MDRGHWGDMPYEVINRRNVRFGKCSDIKIDTANESMSSITHIGKYKGNILCSNGKTKKIVMKNVKVVLGLVKNLFLLSAVMRNDWDLLTETRNNIKILKIKKGDIEYEFDQKVSKNANIGSRSDVSLSVCVVKSCPSSVC